MLNWLSKGLAIFSFFGFLDALYLAIEHYLNRIPPCSLVKGCEQVLTSKYATIFGIPVALFGAVFYIAVFLLVLAYLDSRNERILKFVFFLTLAGFLGSLGFLYLQIFVIKALCFYCLISLGTSTILFLLSIPAVRFQKGGEQI